MMNSKNGGKRIEESPFFFCLTLSFCHRDLSNNEFEGTLTDSWAFMPLNILFILFSLFFFFSQLLHLTNRDVSNNQLEGEIPDFWSYSKADLFVFIFIFC